MAEELTRSLQTLAERGVPRGAANVLDAARAEAAEPAPSGRPTLRRGLAVAAGAAAAVLLAVGAVALFVDRLGGDDARPVVTQPPIATTLPVPIGGPSHPLNEVEALALAPDGQLWAATGGGVVRWDPATGEPTVFGDADGVPASGIDTVDIAPDGTVWVVGSDWIARYDGEWRVFSSMNTPLLDSQIEALAVDADGVVWVDVASEPPLRYDGTWAQGHQPPAGVWADGSGAVAAADGTVWTPGATGITGFDGTETTTLVVPAWLATPRRAALTLGPVPDASGVRVATVIGDLEFTTLQLPVGHSFFATAATQYGPVATEEFEILRWSTDGVTWDGVFPTVAPWRIATHGDDLIVYGDGYVRFAWNGTAWTETAAVDLPGTVRHLAFGSRGAVAILDDEVYYSADGVTFAPADAGPDPALLTTENRSCVLNGPSSSSQPPQPQFGPVLATEAGFVALTPAHPNNWSRTPACEPLIWFSPDGNRWDLVSEQSPFGERAIVHRIAEQNGHFVAVGAVPAEDREGAVWFSTDALAWTRADVAMVEAVGVAGGDLGWMITGRAGVGSGPDDPVDMWFSADGITWDGPHEGPPALGTFYFLPEIAVGTDAVYGVGGTHDTYVVGRIQE